MRVHRKTPVIRECRNRGKSAGTNWALEVTLASEMLPWNEVFGVSGTALGLGVASKGEYKRWH